MSTTTAEAAQKAASVATYGGSAGAIFGGINANEVAAVGGILIGIAGLLLQWYYKHKSYKLYEKKIMEQFPDE